MDRPLEVLKRLHIEAELGHVELQVRLVEKAKDGLFSLETVACLGCCSIAPAMMVNGRFFGRLDKKKLEELIEGWRAAGRVEE